MVGKESTTLKERRNSENNTSSIERRNSSSSNILKSSQDSNNSSFGPHQYVITDEESGDLGISMLPTEKENEPLDETIENVKDVENMNETGNKSKSKVDSNKNDIDDVSEIENSPLTKQQPRPSMKRSSSLEFETLSLNRKKKRSLVVPTDESPNYFNNLSDEVILLIFKQLNRKTLIECSLVCKQWRRLSYDSQFWSRIDLSSKILNQSAVSSLLERNPKYLRMSQTHLSKNLGSLDRCVKTEYLDLSMAKVDENDLAIYLKHFKHLKKLSIENVTINMGVIESISHNEQLNCLNLTMCKNLCDHSLELLLTKCKHITSLNLAWCYLSEESIEVLCSHISSDIVSLNLSGCLKTLENKHIEMLSKKCPKLSELDISDCTQLNDSVTQIIINNFPNLESISISRCYNISPSNYTVILSKPGLRIFNIFGLLHDKQIDILKKRWSTTNVLINHNKFSSIARPTTGDKRTSIWGHRVRDGVV